MKYTDTVHYDTVLIKKIVLLTSKKVSAAGFKKLKGDLRRLKPFNCRFVCDYHMSNWPITSDTSFNTLGTIISCRGIY